ncbi:MAG TPA: MFS transporter [Sphingopyxis sp.]|nr:MFS transporter [Sphingopyxis sp.]HMP43840.1 MFS transporter [Sphingopyxis sp.]HMQ18327.1 MFS transporter [Sphingopyxis sp.]
MQQDGMTLEEDCPALPAAPPLGIARKTAYGLGQMAEGIVTIVFMIYLLFYYNQVLGLSGSATGLALFAALLIDSVADPLMGAISDHTRSRWGRRHPYMYLAVLPLPLCFYLLFVPPAGLGQTELFLWLLAFAVLSRLALTIFFVPHLALGAELSNDYRVRNQIVAYRQFFAMLGYLVALVIGFGFFFVASPGIANGQMNPEVYGPYAATMALVMALGMLISAAGTHRCIPHLRHDEAPGDAQRAPFWRDSLDTLRNPSFRILMIGLLIFYVGFGVRTSLSLHLLTHYWALGPDAIELVTIASILALIAGIVVWAVAGQWIEKRTGFILGFVGWIVLTAWPVLQTLAGFYPPAGALGHVGILLWTGVFASLFGAATNIFAGSMIADCIDEHELLTGRRQEGAFFGVFTVAAKATTGLGTWIGGLALDLIGFPANAKPGTVSEAALFDLGLLTGPVLITGGLAALIFLRRYSISRQRLAEIQAALRERPA